VLLNGCVSAESGFSHHVNALAAATVCRANVERPERAELKKSSCYEAVASRARVASGCFAQRFVVFAEPSVRADRNHRVDSRRMVDRDEQRDCRATNQDRDGAAECDQVERLEPVKQIGEKPHDHDHAERTASQADRNPAGTLSEHQRDNGTK
jgi:hypothetical protein